MLLEEIKRSIIETGRKHDFPEEGSFLNFNMR